MQVKRGRGGLLSCGGLLDGFSPSGCRRKTVRGAKMLQGELRSGAAVASHDATEPVRFRWISKTAANIRLWVGAMADNPGESSFIELTASIVSAYVSNQFGREQRNSNLISQVHSALKCVRAVRCGAGRAAEACGAGQTLGSGRPHCLPRRRPQIQIAQAPFAHALQSYSRSISREVGLATGLSDGGAELCRGPRSQLAKQMGLGQQRRRRRERG